MPVIGPPALLVRSRRTLVAVVAAALLVVLATPAYAAEAGSVGGSRLILSGDLDVPAGTQVGDVLILHGAARVDGAVDGSVVVLDGPVTVRGQVSQDVVALRGVVTIADGAYVGHDVVAPLTPRVADGATVEGAVRRVRADWGWRSIGVSAWWSWLAVSVSVLALGLALTLVAPQAVDAVVMTARSGPARVLVGALAAAVGLPLVAVLAILTVVGIPFGVGLLLSLALLFAVGYVALAWMVGRLVRPRPASALHAFVVGWVVLRVIAVVPFLEGLLWFPGAAVGLGAVAVTVWDARRPSSPVVPSTLSARGSVV